MSLLLKPNVAIKAGDTLLLEEKINPTTTKKRAKAKGVKSVARINERFIYELTVLTLSNLRQNERYSATLLICEQILKVTQI